MPSRWRAILASAGQPAGDLSGRGVNFLHLLSVSHSDESGGVDLQTMALVDLTRAWWNIDSESFLVLYKPEGVWRESNEEID